MLESRYGLRCRPFRPVPDLDFFYPASSRIAALRQLRRALDDDEGVVLLTGAPGIGKTILARKLLAEIDESTRCVLLTNSHMTRCGELLQAILFDLGLPYQGMTEQVARLAVTESCLEHYRGGGKTLLAIDEAHHLNADLLEELRLLSNLEGSAGKAVQVLLIALPSIDKTLAAESLAALRQRLTTWIKVDALDADESADFLRHQVSAAGGQPEQFFGEDVLDILTHAGNGNPRVLNQAAHLAFVLADEGGQECVDAEAAVEAITRLGLDPAANAETLASDEEKVLVMPAAQSVEPVVPERRTAAFNAEPTRSTIPFPPAIFPIENGPPTYVYDGRPDESEPVGPNRPGPWAGAK